MVTLSLKLTCDNLVPRAHVPFGQHQDTELWNNQFPETKILGLPVSRRMRGLVYMVSRDQVEVDTFHKGIQYALEKLGQSKFGFERTAVSNFKSKRHEGSGNELVDYSRAPQRSNECACSSRACARGNGLHHFHRNKVAPKWRQI